MVIRWKLMDAPSPVDVGDYSTGIDWCCNTATLIGLIDFLSINQQAKEIIAKNHWIVPSITIPSLIDFNSWRTSTRCCYSPTLPCFNKVPATLEHPPTFIIRINTTFKFRAKMDLVFVCPIELNHRDWFKYEFEISLGGGHPKMVTFDCTSFFISFFFLDKMWNIN